MRHIRSTRRFLHSISSATIETVERRLLMSSYVVNTLSDAVTPVAGALTLRQAVADANAHTGPDTIIFNPKVFSPGSLHTITLTQGQIEFTDTTGTTTVEGPGASVLAITGNKQSRVFQIDVNASAAVCGLTVTDGTASVADPEGNTYGGGIFNEGTLAIDESNISGNSVQGSGWAQPHYGYGPGNAEGGGIYSSGSLTITNSTLEYNSVSNVVKPQGADGTTFTAGGAVYCGGNLVLSGDTISGNLVEGPQQGTANITANGNAAGGGVYAAGSLSVSNCSVTENSTEGGRASYDLAGPFGDAKGGGLFAGGAVTVIDSSINNNSANAGSTGGDAGGSGGGEGGGIYAGATLSLTNSTVSGNQAAASNDYNGDLTAGGGVFTASNATITQSTISNNDMIGSSSGYYGEGTFAAGGGVYVGGVLTLLQSTISGNSGSCLPSKYGQTGASDVGGGLDTQGGGTILSSTVSGNLLIGGAGSSGNTAYGNTNGGDASGGGIYAAAKLIITNSTIAQNSATGGAAGLTGRTSALGKNGGNAAGGGIYTTAALILADTTVTQNTTTGGAASDAAGPPYVNGAPGTGTGGGVDASGSSSVVITNSILSGDKASGVFDDISAALNSSSANNLIGVGEGLVNGVHGNKLGINNPSLSPLANYGGPTNTMIPLPGSPAIAAGNPALVPAGVTTDQRGFPRTTSGKLDIGAVQFGDVALTGAVFGDAYATGKWQKGVTGLANFTVYLDLNHDGVLDSGDVSSVTNSAGTYTFEDVPAGSYAISIVGQRNYRLTSPSVPAVVTIKTSSPVIGPTFAETQDALISGSVVNAANFKALAGWRVYIDLNRDGKWEPVEPSVVTSSTGTWSFNIPSPGTYQIRIVPMTHYKTTAPAGGLFTFTVGKASARIGNVFSEQKIS